MAGSRRNGGLAGAIGLTALAVAFAWYTNNQPMLDPKETESETEQISRELRPVQPKTVDAYDWAKSTQNLKKIGEAMLKYRAAHPSLPVPQRRSWHDAGLPEHIYLALTELHQPWSVSQAQFIAPVKHDPMIEKRIQNELRHSDYDQQYAVGSYSLDIAASIQRSWAIKGESMIVLSDNSMNTPQFLGGQSGQPKQIELLVLRLNGKVERIKVGSHHWSDLAPYY